VPLPDGLLLTLDGATRRVAVADGWVGLDGAAWHVVDAPPDVDAAAHDHAGGGESSALTAPMPGTVIRVLVDPGKRVEARQPLVVLEAMKMETPLESPYDAVVRRVHVAEGDRVAGGAVLVELEE